MNKYTAIFYSVLYLLVASTFASALGFTTTTGVVVNVRSNGFLAIAEAFWYLTTFKINGISDWITIFLIYPPIILIIWVIASLVRGVE